MLTCILQKLNILARFFSLICYIALIQRSINVNSSPTAFATTQLDTTLIPAPATTNAIEDTAISPYKSVLHTGLLSQ